MKSEFIAEMQSGYNFKGKSIQLGCGILNNEVCADAAVNIPLKTLNRHGLIAGATGTGKTKTLQVLAEQLSENGIPVLMMDIKGDLSGIAKAGKSNAIIEERHQKMNLPIQFRGMPVELMTISHQKGVKLRATVSEFGPVLFSKILGLNDTQSSVMAILFKYCDDKQLPLLDLADVKKVLRFAGNEGKQEFTEHYGQISPASISTILRNILELEQQGAEMFFGEPSFEVDDLCQLNSTGKGFINIIRLTDIQDKPKLFSTFMLCLLAEIYAEFPEQGDAEKPKLVIFIDEAHLIFNESSKALLSQIEAIIKLIRSKGVGIFFCTQNPIDIPNAVLGQLGLKIQHALRAFTAVDRKAIKSASENYPESKFYQTDKIITELVIGEALVTALNEKGIPTPLVATMLRAPMSRMDILNDDEIAELLEASALAEKYNVSINRKSAEEILSAKIVASQNIEVQSELKSQQKKAAETMKNDPSILEELSKNTMVRQIGNTILRELTRGLLGVLGFNNSKTRKRK